MEHTHTIKSAARHSGLKSHLIRMWERRYGAVVPSRTASGRRLYSDDDIRRLTLLRLATLAGESIGQIARLPSEDLARMVRDVPGGLAAGENSTAGKAPQEYLRVSLEATKNLDAAALEANLLAASSSLGKQVFLTEVLTPLLKTTGEEWFNGNIQVVHEHMLSAVVRSLLGSMVLTQPIDDRSPVVIFTTPSGQHHELGVLMASVMAAAIGWKSIYLGPDMPAEDIAAAAEDRKARAIALSIVYPTDDPRLALELKKLSRLLNKKVSILVGGRSANAYEPILTEIGASQVRDFGEFKAALNALRNGN